MNNKPTRNQISDVEQLADEYSKYERNSKWGEVVRSAFKAGYRAALQSKGDDREVYLPVRGDDNSNRVFTTQRNIKEEL